jgi:integrase
LRIFILKILGQPSYLSQLRKLPRSGPREQLVPDEEFDAVYEAAKPRLRLALLLARDAGLRRSAITNLTARSVDFDHNEVFGVTKNQATYRVPMTTRLRSMLAALCAVAGSGQSLVDMLSTQHHHPIKPCTLLWELKATQRRINGGEPFAWSLHDLRRTAARSLYDRTHDVRKVQRLLGHDGPMQTWWYIGRAGMPLDASDLEPKIKLVKKEEVA